MGKWSGIDRPVPADDPMFKEPARLAGINKFKRSTKGTGETTAGGQQTQTTTLMPDNMQTNRGTTDQRSDRKPSTGSQSNGQTEEGFSGKAEGLLRGFLSLKVKPIVVEPEPEEEE